MPYNKKPRDFDAVLGSDIPLIGGLVLGGIEGVLHRLSSTTGIQKASILVEALKYGDLGIDLLKKTADDEANLLHQQKMLNFDTYNLWLDYEGFDIYDWCQNNNLYYDIYHKYNLYSYDQDNEFAKEAYRKLFEILQKRHNIWLIEELWGLMGLKKLAFVHKRIVKQEQIFHFTLSKK